MELLTLQEYRALINKAHRTLTAAIAQKLIKKAPCVVCRTRLVQGHHTDYRLPLTVVWLCHKHHRAAHKGIPSNFMWLGAESRERPRYQSTVKFMKLTTAQKQAHGTRERRKKQMRQIPTIEVEIERKA